MRHRQRITLAIVATALLCGVAGDSLAQSYRGLSRDPILQGNPRRDAGGSCVYDRDGRVVFAPEGKQCRDRRNHLADEGNPLSGLVGEFPPAMQKKLARLLSDHDHIADEMARLRNIIRDGKRSDAIRAADTVSSELTEHTVREERFIERLSPAAKSPSN